MLTALKTFLRLALIPVLYVGGLTTVVLSIFKKAEWGLFLLIILIPQPNIWYKLHDYPLGKDFMDLLIFGIILGMILQKKGFEKTTNSWFVLAFIMLNYLSLWNTSFQFSLPAPLSSSNELLKDWKNYAEMLLLYILVVNVIKTEDQQKFVVILMSVIVLLIAVRSYRNFTGGASFQYDKRVGGPFEAVGLGPNHYGAFIADYGSFFLGMFLYEVNKRRKYILLATFLFGLHPLFYSYSRGAYLAAFSALTFFGLLKKRTLLIIAIAFVLAWKVVLPASVIDRITMTETDEGEIESSAAHRLVLWDHALGLFKENPVFGIGYGGFGYTVEEGELTDTHSFYLKTLAEQGIIGVIFLTVVLLRAILSGWRLFRRGFGMFQQGLGLAFTGTVIAMVITNIFGDRWSYFILGSYFWILWGLVDRGVLISRTKAAEENSGETPVRKRSAMPLRPVY